MRQKKGVSWAEPASSEVGCRSPAALLDFESPFQVVRSRLLSRHALDEVLQVPPEAYFLQRVVQPTCREKHRNETPRLRTRLLVFLRRKPTCSYAEICLVGGDVVDAVMLAREDDVPVLQEHHPGRQAEVRVRPLVDLVGECHKDGQCKQVAVPGVDMVNLPCRKEAETRWDEKLFFFFFFTYNTS